MKNLKFDRRDLGTCIMLIGLIIAVIIGSPIIIFSPNEITHNLGIGVLASGILILIFGWIIFPAKKEWDNERSV